MSEAPFTNREITAMFKEQTRELKDHATGLITPLTTQVTITNGKVKRLYLYLTIIGTVTITLLIVNGSEFVNFIIKII